MTKSYLTLPKWNIAPESKGWSRFTNIVSGLWLLVSGRWKNLTTSPKLIQNDLKRYSLIIEGHLTTTIWFDSGSPYEATLESCYPRNMRSSDAMEISMNSSSKSTAKSWRQFSAENLGCKNFWRSIDVFFFKWLFWLCVFLGGGGVLGEGCGFFLKWMI